MGNDSSRVSDIQELIKEDDFCGFASLIGSVKQKYIAENFQLWLNMIGFLNQYA